MKKRFLFLLAAVLLLVSNSLLAQNLKIEIKPDKKVIHIDKIEGVGNMSLLEYLETLPELTDRSADTFLERYDLKVDGKVIVESRDAVMSSMFLKEVKTIEISNSPSDSHIKNGVSGSVNIIPVNIEKGVSGDAFVLASSATGIMPTATVKYSDGKKFEARANIDVDYYYPSRIKLVEKITESYYETGADTIKNKELGQMARIYAKWTPNDKNIIKAWFWQSFSEYNDNTYSYRTRVEDKSAILGPGWQRSTTETFSNSSKGKQLSLVAILDYTRKINNGELKANADYHYYTSFPQKKDVLNIELKSASNFNIRNNALKMEVALNSSMNGLRGLHDNIFYLSPFLKFEYKWGKIHAIVNGRYKLYARDYAVGGNNVFNGWTRDWTAEACARWQIADRHALKFQYIRTAGMPSNADLYPEFVYDDASQVWRKGNPKLKGVVTNSFNLEYITNWSKGLHNINFDLRADYNIQSGRVEYNVLYDREKRINYLRPVNATRGNVLSLNTMLKYAYGPFSMTFGGNVFYNMEYYHVENLKAGYFNINVNPSIRLNHDWVLYANFQYNSKVYTEHTVIGDCSIFSMHVSKTFGRWTCFAAIQDIFNDLTTDEERRDNDIIRTTYDPYFKTFVLGVSVHL